MGQRGRKKGGKGRKRAERGYYERRNMRRNEEIREGRE